MTFWMTVMFLKTLNTWKTIAAQTDRPDGGLIGTRELRKVIDALKERRLAGTARTDDGDHVASFHREIDADQDPGAA